VSNPLQATKTNLTSSEQIPEGKRVKTFLEAKESLVPAAFCLEFSGWGHHGWYMLAYFTLYLNILEKSAIRQMDSFSYSNHIFFHTASPVHQHIVFLGMVNQLVRSSDFCQLLLPCTI
jgi:hypothetical protein